MGADAESSCTDLVPIPGPRMERETPGQRPRPNYGHPQADTDRVFVVLKGPRRGQPLSAAGLDEIVAGARRRAGIEALTCHQLRHTCFTRLREAGMELEAIQAQAGHRSIKSTRIYLHLAPRAPEPEIVELVDKLARRRPIGVLSNCHEREVRCWAESPLARHVTVFGRSCDIGAMKPDLRPYRWMAMQLRIEPRKSVYVGNGSSDERAGARQAGFGHIVHSNVFDRSNGLVEPQEQLRRARQADTTVDTVDDLDDDLAAR